MAVPSVWTAINSFKQNTNSSNGDHSEHQLAKGRSEEAPLITFFIPDLSIGGAERVTVNIVNGLSRRGFAVELLVSRNTGPLKSELDNAISVTSLWPTHTTDLGVAAHIPALISYFRKREPAIFLPQLEHPSVVSLIAARISQTDSVVIPTQHSSFGQSIDESLKDRIVHALVPRLYPHADGLIAVSNGVAKSITDQTSVQHGAITVLHNPVEVEKIFRESRAAPPHEWLADPRIETIVFVGRLAAQKDLRTWLDVINELHNQRHQTRGILVGTGPKRSELEAYASARGMQGVVSFTGYVENPYAYMGHADVFLLTSHYEGLPTVLIEAMATGCSVVATDCPSGPREILHDGQFGELASIGDVPTLVDAVEHILEEPVDSESLINRARDFSPESVFQQYEQFLNAIIDSETPNNDSVTLNDVFVNS